MKYQDVVATSHVSFTHAFFQRGLEDRSIPNFLERLAPASCILPSQATADRELSPEQLLILAIFEETVLDITGKTRQVIKRREQSTEANAKRYARKILYRTQKRWKDAQDWLDGKEKNDGTFFTFEYCCEALGVQPEIARKNIMAGNFKIQRRSVREQAPLAKGV
jgi:hypothetical protein